MTDDPSGTFAELIPFLVSIIRRLAGQGYRLRLSEALDVVHDFYLDEWADTFPRFDPAKGTLQAYVGRAFARYARRSLVRNAAWHESLGDPPEEVVSGSSETHIDVARVRAAMAKLDAEKRDLLLLQFGDEPLSERQVAAQLGVSRYVLRKRVLDALAALVAVLQAPESLAAADIAVARCLFIDRLPVDLTARRLRMAESEVRAARRRVLEAVKIFHRLEP